MKRCLLSAALAFLAAGSCGAAYELPAVTVTASRTEEMASLVPQAVEVVSAADIARLGAADAAGALRLAMSLDLSEAGRTEDGPVAGRAVMIRGMNTDHTLILVDGMRLADEDTSQTRNVYALSRIPAERIERIEILRGTGSAVYGSDAMGGVINIITKMPAAAGTVLRLTAGTRTGGAAITADTGRQGNWSASVFAKREELRRVRHPQDRTEQTASGVVTRTQGDDIPGYGLRTELGADGIRYAGGRNEGKIRISAGYFHEVSRTVYADSIASAYGMTLPVSVDKRERTERTRRDGSISWSGRTAAHDYTFRLYGSVLEKDMVSQNGRADFPGRFEVLLGGAYPKSERDKARYSTWMLEGRDTLRRGSHTLTYGAEAGGYTYRGTRLASAGAHAIRTGAVYISDSWQRGRLYLAPSVRAERNSKSGSAVTPRLGMTWAWNEKSRTKLSYGMGYRAPSVSELCLRMSRATPIGLVTVEGNAALRPEKSRSFEAAAEWERGKNFTRLAYFRNDLRDLIDTVRQGTGLSYRYENISRARIEGAEAEWRRRINDRLTWRLTGTYLDAKDRAAGGRLAGRARGTLCAALLYNDGRSYGWSGALWETLTASYHFEDKNYTWASLAFSAEKRWKEWSLTLGADNILDRRIDDLYMTGRTWHAALSVRL